MRDEDLEIVDRVCAGDVEAYRQIVERHNPMIHAVLRRMVNDPDDVSELAHETFVRAYRSLPKFRGESKLTTWLVQIAVYAARDHRRQRQRTRMVSLDELADQSDPAAQIAETRSSYDPLLDINERELGERLSAALAGLASSYREVFVLRHLEEMSYEEISQVTGDTVGSLKVRNHRARKLLREAMSEPAHGSMH